MPSLSKFLNELCTVSRETAERSGAPPAGGRYEAGLSARRCFCSEQHGAVGLKPLLLCADVGPYFGTEVLAKIKKTGDEMKCLAEGFMAIDF